MSPCAAFNAAVQNDKLNLPNWAHPPADRRMTMEEYIAFVEDGLQFVNRDLADKAAEANRITVPFRILPLVELSR